MVQQFIDEHASSDYSILASMQLAKVQVESKHLDEALAQLEIGRKNIPMMLR
ncbi:tetratricopeptide repeat protein [Vibrio sp. PP-XX7]